MTVEQRKQLVKEMEELLTKSKCALSRGDFVTAEIYEEKYYSMERTLIILGYKVETNKETCTVNISNNEEVKL